MIFCVLLRTMFALTMLCNNILICNRPSVKLLSSLLFLLCSVRQCLPGSSFRIQQPGHITVRRHKS